MLAAINHDLEVNETLGHGAHYWCGSCYSSKMPAFSGTQETGTEITPFEVHLNFDVDLIDATEYSHAAVAIELK